MEGCSEKIPLKRNRLALAENADNLEESDHAIVIGSCMSDIAIVQSGLLSGEENIEGLASLPSNLSPVDVRLWETSHFVDVEFPPEELVTVLKVACALGDTKVTKWVNKLAAMVVNTDWKQSQLRDSMLCSLFRLPSHLLHLVTTACLSNSTGTRHPLHAMMLTIPPALHPAMVSAAAADGHIAFDHVVAESVLLTLPFTAVPDPGLLRIDISTPPHPYSESCRSSPATAALLGRAASAHPSLTRLSLSAAPLSPQWLRAFSSCLAPSALPALADLTLCADAHPGGCAEVMACVCLLPALTSLDVSLCLHSQPNTAPVSLSAYARLTATPAFLPHLKRLTYRDGADNDKYSFYQRRWAFQRSVETSCAHSFLSLISAPALETLSLTLMSRMPMQSLLAQVARIKSLQELSISGALRASQLPSSRRSQSALQPLPRLAQLAVEGCCATSAFGIAAATAALALASLTHLSLYHDPDPGEICLDDSDDEEVSLTTSAVAGTCQDFYGTLRCCTSLQLLEVPCILGASPISEAGCCDGLAPALMHLPQLTRLWLRADTQFLENIVRLDGSVLSRVIAGQPQLRSLWLDGTGDLTVEPMQPVLEACAQLRHVTSMDMSLQGVTHAHVTDLLVKLPSLRHLQTWASIFDNAEEGAIAALQSRFTNVQFELD